MPTYEYKCLSCSDRFELRQSWGEGGSANCPDCGAKAERLFSVPGVIFKGSGFYVTDTRSQNSGSKPSKPEAKKNNKDKASKPSAGNGAKS